jgi:hypothetical protein
LELILEWFVVGFDEFCGHNLPLNFNDDFSTKTFAKIPHIVVAESQ